MSLFKRDDYSYLDTQINTEESREVYESVLKEITERVKHYKGEIYNLKFLKLAYMVTSQILSGFDIDGLKKLRDPNVPFYNDIVAHEKNELAYKHAIAYYNTLQDEFDALLGSEVKEEE